MARKLMLFVGVLLLLAGAVGFLAAAVALADADKVPEIKNPKGVEITLPPDDPVVLERKHQAETVLFGSLLCGGVGLVVIIVCVWVGKRTTPPVEAATSASEQQGLPKQPEVQPVKPTTVPTQEDLSKWKADAQPEDPRADRSP